MTQSEHLMNMNFYYLLILIIDLHCLEDNYILLYHGIYCASYCMCLYRNLLKQTPFEVPFSCLLFLNFKLY